MKQKWTVEMIVDLEKIKSLWPHVDDKAWMELINQEDGILEIGEDGIHYHRFGTCDKLLNWRVILKDDII
jgi:hypothetical protein